MDPLAQSVANRVASDPPQILRLIVQGVLRERNVSSLVDAWIEASVEDWEEAHGGSPEHSDVWLAKELGVLIAPRQVEKAVQNAYVEAYRRMIRVSPQEALGVFEWPKGFPDDRLPMEVVEAVGVALGTRDGRDGRALREYARQHAR